jgi:hypothetical protein
MICFFVFLLVKFEGHHALDPITHAQMKPQVHPFHTNVFFLYTL